MIPNLVLSAKHSWALRTESILRETTSVWLREAWHFCKQLPKKKSGKCSKDAVGSFRGSCIGKRALEGREGLVWVGTVAAEELNIQGSERRRFLL